MSGGFLRLMLARLILSFVDIIRILICSHLLLHEIDAVTVVRQEMRHRLCIAIEQDTLRRHPRHRINDIDMRRAPNPSFRMGTDEFAHPATALARHQRMLTSLVPDLDKRAIRMRDLFVGGR